jgi:WD40 repeat protein
MEEEQGYRVNVVRDGGTDNEALSSVESAESSGMTEEVSVDDSPPTANVASRAAYIAFACCRDRQDDEDVKMVTDNGHSEPNRLEVWIDLVNGATFERLEALHCDDARSDYIHWICFSPDNTKLAACTEYGEASKVWVWQLLSPGVAPSPSLELCPAGHGVVEIQFDSSGRKLVGSGHTLVTVWDTATGTMIWNSCAEYILNRCLFGFFRSVSDSHDELMLGLQTDTDYTRQRCLQFACRDLASDEVLRGEGSFNGITMTSPVCGNGDFVTAFTAAPDGHHVAVRIFRCTSSTYEVCLLDIELGSCHSLRRLSVYASLAMAFNYSSTIFAYSCSDIIYLWDIQNAMERIVTVRGHLRIVAFKFVDNEVVCVRMEDDDVALIRIDDNIAVQHATVAGDSTTLSLMAVSHPPVSILM